MVVIFTFPGEKTTSFRVNMESVPRDKEAVLVNKIIEDDFPGKKEYYTFKENGYEFRQWTVASVAWTPVRKGESFVNIMLKEAGT